MEEQKLKELIKNIRFGILEDRTAIGSGLVTSVNRLVESESKSKVIILLSDGENTAGKTSPVQAAQIAAEFDITIYTIGVGKKNAGFFGLSNSVDEKTLTEILPKNADIEKILEKILKDSWTLKEEDKDMIVMQHLFGYELNGEKHQIESSMVCLGDNQTYTAMAKTVGLPVAIATLKILNGEITTSGVQIPIKKEVYEPILKELEENGIVFKEKHVPYLGYNPENVNG